MSPQKGTKKMVDPLSILAKLSVPLGVATTIFGGSAWLTTTHNTVVETQQELEEMKADTKENRKAVYQKLSNQDERLSRMEGKIDIIIQNMPRITKR